jgi:hypothetical protein
MNAPQFSYKDHEHEQQRFHGTRVEARQAEQRAGGRPKADPHGDAIIDRLFGGGARPTKTAAQIDDLFFTALLLDLLASNSRKEPEPQERITPFDDANGLGPFWKRLNATLEARGKPEANYGEARTLFEGGETPVGAMTFIGKQWDGLRAVPAKPVTYLGGERPAYHGEYKEVTGLTGTVWHKVVNQNGDPIVYKLPEAAITAAEDQRARKINKLFR